MPTHEQIKPYIEKGLIAEGTHPENPDVRIFNYTQTCQFSKAWDDITRQCRGLIMNVVTGEVLARPFPKFFNHGEHVGKGLPIPAEAPVISEKLDGSLGILYALNGVPYIATRGSFISDQSQWATKWWRDHIGMLPEEGQTNLFEIIYPENRIVVNYDFSGLVHLITLDNKTGKPVHQYWHEPVRAARTVAVTDLDTLCKMDEPNSEGFVLYYPTSDLRLKIKFPEYVRLHKLVTGVNEIAIWEHLREGKGTGDLIQKVPDEFMKWVTDVESRLRADFAKLWGEAQMAVQMVRGMQTRKEQAQWVMQNAKKVSGSVFSLLDNDEKKAADSIWKMVRPSGSKLFKVDIDL
jgi:RNA ligase